MLPFTDPVTCVLNLWLSFMKCKKNALDMVFLAITVNVDIKKDAETLHEDSYSESSDVLC